MEKGTAENVILSSERRKFAHNDNSRDNPWREFSRADGFRAPGRAIARNHRERLFSLRVM
jgi:hypothetical protein